jgi:hypothetical protein
VVSGKGREGSVVSEGLIVVLQKKRVGWRERFVDVKRGREMGRRLFCRFFFKLI